mmetsp:Transcript_7305/g.22098  ORF Transcript_7305/g.22098 Transcript_7305/m.22098 type:complete len:237 (+) Transcript_7305:1843-2553(+)
MLTAKPSIHGRLTSDTPSAMPAKATRPAMPSPSTLSPCLARSSTSHMCSLSAASMRMRPFRAASRSGKRISSRSSPSGPSRSLSFGTNRPSVMASKSSRSDTSFSRLSSASVPSVCVTATSNAICRIESSMSSGSSPPSAAPTQASRLLATTRCRLAQLAGASMTIGLIAPAMARRMARCSSPWSVSSAPSGPRISPMVAGHLERTDLSSASNSARVWRPPPITVTPAGFTSGSDS